MLAPDDANFDETYRRVPGAYGPDEVSAHPGSDSPFGVADMVGNISEWVRSVHPGEVVIRSSTFFRDSLSNRIVTRIFGSATLRNNEIGARMCADVARTGTPKES